MLPDRIAVYFHDLRQPQWPAFRAMVEALRGEGYRFVPDPTDFAAPSAERLAWISFDDNHKAWFDARRLFDELEVRAVFYTNTLPFRDRADDPTIADYHARINAAPNVSPPLTVAELQSLHADGHIIGAHAHSHFQLSSLPEDAAQSEITMCRDALIEITRGNVDHFSFPYGFRRHFPSSLRAFCLSEGFKSIANATPGLLHCSPSLSGLNRTPWITSATTERNLMNLRIDGRWFESITGRSAVPF